MRGLLYFQLNYSINPLHAEGNRRCLPRKYGLNPTGRELNMPNWMVHGIRDRDDKLVWKPNPCFVYMSKGLCTLDTFPPHFSNICCYNIMLEKCWENVASVHRAN